MRAIPRAAKLGLSAVAVLILLLLMLLLNLNWFRGPIERAVTGATGRETQIGDLRMRGLFPPTIEGRELSLANAAWARDEPLFAARRLRIQPLVWRVIRGQFAFRSVEGEGLRLRLETDDQGRGNWVFGPDEQPPPEERTEPLQVEIRRLALADSRLDLRERPHETEIALTARTGEGEASDRLLLAGDGRYRGAPFELQASIGLPQQLDSEDLSVNLVVDASAGSFKVHAEGDLPAAVSTTGADLDVRASGDSLSEVYDLLGVPLPETPPFELAGRLGWTPSTVQWDGFDGRVGDSRLTGDAKVEFGGQRPKLTANLTSPLLDFDDLGALIGIPPSTEEGETASPEQQQKKAELQARGRVLPDSPFDFNKLRGIDADVRLVAESIQAPRLPLQRMNAHLRLNDGVLALAPFDFDAAGGNLETRIRLDATREPLGYELDLGFRDLRLAELVPKAESLKDAVGALGGKAELRGSGNSVAAMFASAEGSIVTGMGPGQVSNLLLELAGLDVAEALKFLVGDDRKVAIRCAYADLAVRGGVGSVEAMSVDTNDTALLGRGSIDFGQEKFDLTLLPRPKDTSPISLRSPLRIGGTFADPAFGPSPVPLLLRGAAVVALAAVAPPAALLGLIETGPGEDVGCGPGRNADTVEAESKAGEARERRPPPGPRPPPAGPVSPR